MSQVTYNNTMQQFVSHFDTGDNATICYSSLLMQYHNDMFVTGPKK